MAKDRKVMDLLIRLNEKNYRNTLCMYTWVIIQSFIDYASKSNNKRMLSVRKDAEKWIMEDNDGFFEVCEIVSISPEKVRAKFLQLKNSDCDIAKVINIIKSF